MVWGRRDIKTTTGRWERELGWGMTPGVTPIPPATLTPTPAHIADKNPHFNAQELMNKEYQTSHVKPTFRAFNAYVRVH